MQLKQFTRTQMTEDINLNYEQNRPPAIHGANSSLQSMSALRGSNSLPLALYARCYPTRHRAPKIWTNPRTHYCPENIFLLNSLSILMETFNFNCIIEKYTFDIRVTLYSAICKGNVIWRNKCWLVHLNSENLWL